MKKLYKMLLSFLFSVCSTAQTTIDCATVEEENTGGVFFSPFNTPLYSGSTDLAYLSSYPKISFDIYFWIINKTDGSGDYNVTPVDIQINLDRINEMYRPMGICFVLKGIGNINNTNIYDNTNFGSIVNYANANGKVIANCLNVYLPKLLSAGNGVTNSGANQLVVTQAVTLGVWGGVPGNILAHEIAHDFGLMHCWGTGNNVMTTSEHVTRDSSSPNYNALTTADLIHDTPAMVSFQAEAAAAGTNIYGIVDQYTCEYLGSLTDTIGVPFDLSPTDVGNPMAYTVDTCVHGFTVGQGVRIREWIDNNSTEDSVLAMNNLSCADCVENLTIALPVERSESFRVENTITASSQISDNLQVTYSGTGVILGPGFEVTGSNATTAGIFIAEVNPCEISEGRFANPDIKMSTDIMGVAVNIFSISPNPANSFATIASGEEISDILVTSLDGKVLFKANPRANNVDIIIDNYATGIYNVTIITVSGRKQTQKLVKN